MCVCKHRYILSLKKATYLQIPAGCLVMPLLLTEDSLIQYTVKLV